MTSFFAVNPSNERLSNHAQRSSWPRPPPPELRATRLGVTAELDANHVLNKCHPANAPPERRCEPGLARPGAAERGLHPGAAQPGAQRPGKARPSLCAIRMCRTASRPWVQTLNLFQKRRCGARLCRGLFRADDSRRRAVGTCPPLQTPQSGTHSIWDNPLIYLSRH